MAMLASLVKLRGFLLAAQLPIIVLTLCLISVYITPLFLSPMNLKSLLREVATTGVIAIGAFFVMTERGVDLSIDGIVPAASILVANWVYLEIMPVWVTITLIIGFGMLVGAANGVLTTYGKMESFVATLALMITLKGFAYYYGSVVGIRYVMVNDPVMLAIGAGRIFNTIPVPVVIWLGIAILSSFFLRDTIVGRRMVAVGGNPDATRTAGLKNNNYIILAFMLSGGLAVVCGLMVTGLVGMGSPLIGVGYSLDAIAAVVVGGGSFRGGRGTVIGVVLGAVILGIISNLLNLMEVAEYPKMMIKGGVIIVAVLVRDINRSE